MTPRASAVDPPDRAIVFLDIDGVLNSQAWLDGLNRRVEIVGVWDEEWAEQLDPACVERLSRIVAATGAAVVVSSSWREVMPVSQVAVHLRTRGFTGDVIDRTPTTGYRGEEIRAWLSTHAMVDRYVVLDDDPRAGGPDRHVKTMWAVGLTDADVERAISILRGNP